MYKKGACFFFPLVKIHKLIKDLRSKKKIVEVSSKLEKLRAKIQREERKNLVTRST